MENVLRRFRRWSRWWALGEFGASSSLCFDLKDWQVRGKCLSSFNNVRFICLSSFNYVWHPVWVRLKWLILCLTAVSAWQGGHAHTYHGLYSQAIVDRSAPNYVTQVGPFGITLRTVTIVSYWRGYQIMAALYICFAAGYARVIIFYTIPRSFGHRSWYFFNSSRRMFAYGPTNRTNKISEIDSRYLPVENREQASIWWSR